MNKYIKIICISLLFLFTGVYGINAYLTDTYQSDNHMTYDTVEIATDCKQDENEGNNIVANQSVKVSPMVINKGASCYIRVKWDFIIGDTNSDLGVKLSNDWYQGIDGYWYYLPILKEEESVVLFDYISFGNLDNSFKDKSCTLDITYQAIQARNFTPNYEIEDCWNGNKIIKTIRSRVIGGDEDGK